MESIITPLLHQNGLDVVHFDCQCTDCSKSGTEYTDSYAISYVSKGSFTYHTYTDAIDAYAGKILISKPNYEYQVSHPSMLRDQCFSICMSNDYFEQIREDLGLAKDAFYDQKDTQALLLDSTPMLDILWSNYIASLYNKDKDKLLKEEIQRNLLANIFSEFQAIQSQIKISEKVKKQHLDTIEFAKEIIKAKYQNELSLESIAKQCLVSPYHFSRIFKQITMRSPYQYLLAVRLSQAILLLKENYTVEEIAFKTGFNSAEHFATIFKSKFKITPTEYRLKK